MSSQKFSPNSVVRNQITCRFVHVPPVLEASRVFQVPPRGLYQNPSRRSGKYRLKRKQLIKALLVYQYQLLVGTITDMRIALYARVSTKDRGQDHENQLRELREFVRRKKADGWEVVEEFVDRASGKTAARPAFQRMFEQASRKEFDLVVFWSLDRFPREGVRETLNHLQRLTSYGVDWFSYREEYLRSLGGFRDAVLAILAAIAKQERVRIQGARHCWAGTCAGNRD